jgi:hypothetical protein
LSIFIIDLLSFILGLCALWTRSRDLVVVFAFATALSGKIVKLLLANHNIIAIYILSPTFSAGSSLWEFREMEKILDAVMAPMHQWQWRKLYHRLLTCLLPELTILPTYITRVALTDSRLKRY